VKACFPIYIAPAISAHSNECAVFSKREKSSNALEEEKGQSPEKGSSGHMGYS